MAVRYREQYKSWQVYYTNPFTGKRVFQTFSTEHQAKEADSL